RHECSWQDHGCASPWLCITMAVHQLSDRQVFYRIQIKLADNTTAVLVGKAVSLPGDALMHLRHDLASLSAHGRALLRFGQAPLRFGITLLGEQVLVQPAALLTPVFEVAPLLLVRVQTVLERPSMLLAYLTACVLSRPKDQSSPALQGG